jgi:hypothetical protein
MYQKGAGLLEIRFAVSSLVGGGVDLESVAGGLPSHGGFGNGLPQHGLRGLILPDDGNLQLSQFPQVAVGSLGEFLPQLRTLAAAFRRHVNVTHLGS